MSSPRTTCPISREQYRQGATPLTLTIDGQPLPAGPKEFSTGSLGWFANGKVLVEINGQSVMAQVSANITVIGSKELPR